MTTNTPATPTPPPGSPEAVALGCLCGVPDRAGDVVYYVRVVNYSTWYVYVNPDCPLHGHGAPEAKRNPLCKCDLDDTPEAPADWHAETCPEYRPAAKVIER